MVRINQDPITINELFSILFEDCTGREILMLIKAYIDDSADKRQEVVMVAGCFIGIVKQWSKFKRQWKKALQSNNLGYFRSTEYYSLRGEFAQFRDKEKFPEPKGREAAKKARDDLSDVIEETGIAGLASCIPVPLYEQFRGSPGSKAELLGNNIFEVALRSLFRETCKSIREEFGPQHRVAFLCDESPNSEQIKLSYTRFKERHPHDSEMIVSFTTADDKAVLPLQSADLMASLAKETYHKWAEARESHPPSLLSGSIFSISAWTEETFADAIKYEESSVVGFERTV